MTCTLQMAFFVVFTILENVLDFFFLKNQYPYLVPLGGTISPYEMYAVQCMFCAEAGTLLLKRQCCVGYF